MLIGTPESMDNMIEMRHDEFRGRFLVALKDIPKGTVVLQCLPFSSVISRSWCKEVCHYCYTLSYPKKLKHKCSKGPCMTWYCSDSCADKDRENHIKACDLLSRLDKEFRKHADDQNGMDISDEDHDMMRLVILSFARLHDQEHEDNHRVFKLSSLKIPDAIDFYRMQQNMENVKVHNATEYMRMQKMFKFLTQKVHVEISEQKFNAILYREKANSFGIWDESCGELLGYAIYPLAAYFNHSCDSNVCKKYEKNVLYFETTRDVGRGEELCISYGGLEGESGSERRNRLFENYFFECSCDSSKHFPMPFNKPDQYGKDIHADSGETSGLLDNIQDNFIDIHVDVQNAVQDGMEAVTSFYSDFVQFIRNSPAIPVGFGIVVGNMFVALIDSLTNDIITPPLGLIFGDSFKNLFIVLKEGEHGSAGYPTLEAARADGAITINYGSFLNAILFFVVVSLILYIFIRVYSVLKRKALRSEQEQEEIFVRKDSCPECLEQIHAKARRCPFCTAIVERPIETSDKESH